MNTGSFCKKISALFLLTAIFIASSVYGDEDYGEGWEDSLSLSFGFEWQKGNTEMLCYNYSFAYNTSFPKQWNLELGIEGRYGSTDDELSEAANKMALAIDRILFGGNLSLLYNGDIEEDRFQNIYTRINSGLGLKLSFNPAWWIQFSASSVPVVDYTRTFDRLESESLWRLRSGASLILNFSQESENNLNFNFRHEPDMKNFDDYRYEFEASLNLSVMGNLSFQNAYKTDYVSQPLDAEDFEVKKRDHSFTSCLTLSI